MLCIQINYSRPSFIWKRKSSIHVCHTCLTWLNCIISKNNWDSLHEFAAGAHLKSALNWTSCSFCKGTALHMASNDMDHNWKCNIFINSYDKHGCSCWWIYMIYENGTWKKFELQHNLCWRRGSIYKRHFITSMAIEYYLNTLLESHVSTLGCWSHF